MLCSFERLKRRQWETHPPPSLLWSLKHLLHLPSSLPGPSREWFPRRPFSRPHADDGFWSSHNDRWAGRDHCT